ncbi:hypothetical protein CDEST_00054 [Colletotrichum destructivum]|uniref:SBP-type domain-containing protein n=1 Tax=Colletotrichum destructivum TaxID=34406 RepID=A0AAX4HVG0_9PEZI|nr:hypothetical protein CDEST_00054 [Colletotrichum destructivum]
MAGKKTEEKEPGLFVSDDEDDNDSVGGKENPGNEEEEEEEEEDYHDSDTDSYVSTIDANGNPIAYNGRGREIDPHHGCTRIAYASDGQEYTGDAIRRCKAVAHNPIYATWCFCIRHKRCKPEINFTDRNGRVTCRSCHDCRAASETRTTKDKRLRKKFMAKKVKEWRSKALPGHRFHYGKPTKEQPRRNPESDDEDLGGKGGSSGGGIAGTLIAVQ